MDGRSRMLPPGGNRASHTAGPCSAVLLETSPAATQLQVRLAASLLTLTSRRAINLSSHVALVCTYKIKDVPFNGTQVILAATGHREGGYNVERCTSRAVCLCLRALVKICSPSAVLQARGKLCAIATNEYRGVLEANEYNSL